MDVGQRPCNRVLGLALAIMVIAGCSDDGPPASSRVRLEILGLDTLPSAPATLRLALYGEEGWLLTRRLPALDGEREALVYSPLAEGTLRLLLYAEDTDGAHLAEGASQVALVSGGEARTSIALEVGRRPDGDGDGIPDAIDNCPSLANPEQRPLCLADAAVGDGARDAGVDTGSADGSAADLVTPGDTSCPSLSGDYEIKPGGAGSRTFQTFSQAIAKLQACGVSGAVTVKVAAGSYTQSQGFRFGPIPGAGPSSQVRFVGATGGAAETRLVSQAGSHVILIAPNTAHLILKSLVIDGSDSGNALKSAGALIRFDPAGGQSNVALTEFTLRNLRGSNWTTTNASAAIDLSLASSTSKRQAITIAGCRFLRISPPQPGGAQALILVNGGAHKGLAVRANTFSEIDGEVFSLRAGSVDKLDVFNNMIALSDGAAMRLATAVTLSDARFMFNSVLAVGSGAAGVRGPWGGRLWLNANAFEMVGAKGGSFVTGVGTSKLDTSFNCISTAASYGFTSSMGDKKGNVAFVSTSAPYDLHLRSSSDCLDAGGAPVSGVTVDIDGDTRNNPPDIGADER